MKMNEFTFFKCSMIQRFQPKNELIENLKRLNKKIDGGPTFFLQQTRQISHTIESSVNQHFNLFNQRHFRQKKIIRIRLPIAKKMQSMKIFMQSMQMQMQMRVQHFNNHFHQTLLAHFNQSALHTFQNQSRYSLLQIMRKRQSI